MKHLMITIGLGVLAIAMLIFGVSQCTKKGVAYEQRDIAVANEEACREAYVYDTVYIDTTEHILAEVIVPVPYEVLRIDTIVVHDIEYVYPSLHYEDTLLTDDFALFWEAEGVINEISFPYYRLYEARREISNVITKKEYVYKPMSHLFFNFGLNTKFEKGLSGFSSGFDYINRKGWGVGVNYYYMDKTSYFGANLKLRIL